MAASNTGDYIIITHCSLHQSFKKVSYSEGLKKKIITLFLFLLALFSL